MLNFRCLLFIFFHCFLSPLVAIGHETEPDVSVRVKRVSETLYLGKKESNVYFVMERIDRSVPNVDARLAFWQQYAKEEHNNHTEYKRKWSEGLLPKGKGFLVFQDRSESLTAGLTSFQTSLNKYSLDNELWIAYVSTKPIETAGEVTPNDIEMVVTVLTDKEAPMVTHMGIGRSFHYLLKALQADQVRESVKHFSEKELQEFGIIIPTEDKFNLHRHLSMELHSFAAQVMRSRDPKKLYMITSPAPKMREIMCKTFPQHIYISDDYKAAREQHHELKKSGASLLSTSIWAEHEKVSKDLRSLKKQIKKSNRRFEANHELIELEESETKMEEQKDRLFNELLAQEAKEIDEIFEKIKPQMTLSSTPLQANYSGNKVRLFDRERKNIIFDHDKGTQTIRVNSQELRGEETKRYGWFYHPDMRMNPYVTINLEELASYLMLMPF